MNYQALIRCISVVLVPVLIINPTFGANAQSLMQSGEMPRQSLLVISEQALNERALPFLSVTAKPEKSLLFRQLVSGRGSPKWATSYPRIKARMLSRRTFALSLVVSLTGSTIFKRIAYTALDHPLRILTLALLEPQETASLPSSQQGFFSSFIRSESGTSTPMGELMGAGLSALFIGAALFFMGSTLLGLLLAGLGVGGTIVFGLASRKEGSAHAEQKDAADASLLGRRSLFQLVSFGVYCLADPLSLLAAPLRNRTQRLQAAEDLLDPSQKRDKALQDLIDTAASDPQFRQELLILALREKARHQEEIVRAQLRGNGTALVEHQQSGAYIDHLLDALRQQAGSPTLLHNLFLAHPDPVVSRQALRQAAQLVQGLSDLWKLSDLPVLVEALANKSTRQMVVSVLNPLPGLAQFLKYPFLRSLRQARYFHDSEKEIALKEAAALLIRDASVFRSDILLRALPDNAPLREVIYSILVSHSDLADTPADYYAFQQLMYDLQNPKMQDDVLTLLNAIEPARKENQQSRIFTVLDDLIEARESHDYDAARKLEFYFERLRQRREMLEWLIGLVRGGIGNKQVKIEMLKYLAQDPYAQLSTQPLTRRLADRLFTALRYEATRTYAAHILKTMQLVLESPSQLDANEKPLTRASIDQAIRDAMDHPDLESQARAALLQLAMTHDSEEEVSRAIEQMKDSPKKDLMKEIHEFGLNYIADAIEKAISPIQREEWMKRLAGRMKVTGYVYSNPALMEALIEGLLVPTTREPAAVILLGMDEISHLRTRRNLVRALLKARQNGRMEVDKGPVNAKLEEFIKQAGDEKTGLWKAFTESDLSRQVRTEALRRLGLLTDLSAAVPADQDKQFPIDIFSAAAFDDATATAILGHIKDPEVRAQYMQGRNDALNRSMQRPSSPDLLDILLSQHATVDDFLFLYVDPDSDSALRHEILKILVTYPDLSQAFDEHSEAIPILTKDLVRAGEDALVTQIVSKLTSPEVKQLIRDTLLLQRPDLYEAIENPKALVDILETSHTPAVLQQALASLARSPHRASGEITRPALQKLMELIESPNAAQLLAAAILPFLAIPDTALARQLVETLLSGGLRAQLAGNTNAADLYTGVLKACLAVPASMNALIVIGVDALDYRLRQEAARYLPRQTAQTMRFTVLASA